MYDMQYTVFIELFSMKCTGGDAGALQVQVQCLVYTVQCTLCSVLSASDEDLAVETG